MKIHQSKIEKLISELCPNGVEFKELGEVCKIKTGESVSKTIIDQTPGKYPVINSGKEPLGYIDRFNTENDPIGITSRGAGVGSVTWCEGKYFRGNLNYSVTINDFNQLNIRFLYHLLMQDRTNIKQLATYQGIPALNKSKLEKIKIPIPPLPVQQEIVKILDNFTKLEAELEAELEARKKQYEYYRDELLTFDDGVEHKSLGEIATITRGVRLVRSQLAENGKYPVYQNSMTPLGYYEASNCPANTTFVISAGAAGEIGYSAVDFWAADDCFYFVCPEQLQSRFLYYALLCKQNYLFSRVRRASVPRLARSVVERIKIPVPPLAEQERIVAILDKFDALVNDISAGLPAELNARRKQYEYYRNKLLTFNGK